MKAIQAKKNKEKNEANQSKQKSISSYFGAKPAAKQEISEPKVADENLKRKLELFKSDGNGESSIESQIKPTISTLILRTKTMIWTKVQSFVLLLYLSWAYMYQA